MQLSRPYRAPSSSRPSSRSLRSWLNVQWIRSPTAWRRMLATNVRRSLFHLRAVRISPARGVVKGGQVVVLQAVLPSGVAGRGLCTGDGDPQVVKHWHQRRGLRGVIGGQVDARLPG